MVVRIFLASVHVEEAGDGFLAAEDNITWCQRDGGRIPLEHLFIRAFRVGHTVVAPSEHRRRSRLESLEFALSRLLVFVVDGELLELQWLRWLFLPAVDEMHKMSSWILECDDLAAGRAM